jgi:hypothetical protein
VRRRLIKREKRGKGKGRRLAVINLEIEEIRKDKNVRCSN